MAAERRELLAGYTRSLRPAGVVDGLDLAVEHHPNTRSPGSFGGDFYDWWQADDKVVVALGDVTGKGISAAGAARMLVWSLRALSGPDVDSAMLAGRLDQVVAHQLDTDRFVTLCLLSVDVMTGAAELVLAGHPAPLRLGASRAAFVDCPPGPPLGVNPGQQAAPVTLTLDPGEALVLFTDGLTDALDSRRVRYGPQRLLSSAAAATSADGWDAGDLAATLWHDVHAWSGATPDDDCAIVVVKRPD